MPDKLADRPRGGSLGLRCQSFGHAGSMAQVRQGVGTQHRANQGVLALRPPQGKNFRSPTAISAMVQLWTADFRHPALRLHTEKITNPLRLHRTVQPSIRRHAACAGR
jgi:hypothetical protein